MAFGVIFGCILGSFLDRNREGFPDDCWQRFENGFECWHHCHARPCFKRSWLFWDMFMYSVKNIEKSLTRTALLYQFSSILHLLDLCSSTLYHWRASRSFAKTGFLPHLFRLFFGLFLGLENGSRFWSLFSHSRSQNDPNIGQKDD